MLRSRALLLRASLLSSRWHVSSAQGLVLYWLGPCLPCDSPSACLAWMVSAPLA